LCAVLAGEVRTADFRKGAGEEDGHPGAESDGEDDVAGCREEEPSGTKVLGPGGAMETMEAAKKEGKIRYIGFSVHSQETAVAAMHRYPFDTVLFPVNFVLFSQAKFGPQILATAQEKKMGILALKAMAKTTWPAAEKKNHPEPKCWYQPAAYPNEAALGLRWTLGHPITAALPPGDEKYFRLAMDVAQNYKPLEKHEEVALLSGAVGAEPIFHLGNDV
ncbi:MAG: aldo/keto reductase, partial [Acidobacteriaceae bacterium]